MTSNNTTSLFRLNVIAASILLAMGTAHGQAADDLAETVRQDLARPNSAISVGVGHLSGQSRQFGTYNGLDSEGTYGLLNFDLVNRDDATGTWLKLKGRDLGLASRELRFDHERQGDWSYFIEGSQLARKDPKVVHTAMLGVGTTNQTLAAAAAPRHDYDFSINHDVVGIGFRKHLPGGWNIRMNFRQDEKNGDRVMSHYQIYAGGAVFSPEPIDRTTRQWDIVASYADRKLQLTGGYSGSAFQNDAQRIDVTTSVINPSTGIPYDLLHPTIGLPASNEAHQLHLSGGYTFSNISRSSFKISRAVALQTDQFAIAPDPALTGRTSLGGKLVTTLAFADLTSRPTDRLDLTFNVRYEDRDDRTPTAHYLTGSAANSAAGIGSNFLHAGYTGFNIPRSMTQWKETLEAGYRIADGYRLVGTLEREDTKQSVPAEFRRVSHREKLEETTGRLELKLALSETLNGSAAYSYSDRGGSEYMPDTNVPEANSNQVNPLHWSDRKRQKLRLTGDWTPNDQWSLQLVADASDDLYMGRDLGPRKGKASFLGLDATYSLSDKWKLTGWVSQERTNADQLSRTPTDHVADFTGPGPELQNIIWQARIRNVNTAWGVTLKGKPVEKLEVAADISNSVESVANGMQARGGTITIESLPDFYYRQLTLKLSADYALERNSGIRGQFLYDRRHNNDWTWSNNWSFGNVWSGGPLDGTTVSQPGRENARFVGVTYYHRWR